MKKCRFFEQWIKQQNRRRTKRSRRWNKALALGAVTYLNFSPQSSHADETPALPEVLVTGQKKSYRSDVSTLPKYTQPLADTPQSISIVPQEVLRDQNVTTLRDALRNVAGISLAAGEAGAQGDNLTLRGFSARSDIFKDGMRDFGSYYRDSFDLQQAEVLKGPASVSFGRGSTGGVINQVSKAASLDPYNSVGLTFGTDKTKRAVADINQPLTELGHGSAVRLNMMGQQSEVAGRDIGDNSRFGFAPSFVFGLGTSTRLALDYFHQSDNNVPDYGLPFLLSRPAPVDRDNFYGFKDENHLKTQADIETAKIEHDFGSAITIRDQARYANYKRSAQITEPQILGTVTAATPLSAININRNQITVDSVETYQENQFDLTGRFKTGPVDHTVVAGVEFGQETSDPKRFAFTGVPTTSLLSPNSNQPFAGTETVTSKTHTLAHTLATYLLDTLKLGSHWELTGGVRWDRFAADYSAQAAATATNPANPAFHRVDEMTSYRGALVYKPVEIGSFYASYGTSFNPSAEQLALAANTANVDPEKSKTYEVGSKWDLLNRQLTVTGALFRDDKTDARTVDPNNSLLNVLSGDQRVQGVEVAASGHVTEKWQVFTSYAYMDTKVRESNNPLEVGNPLANAPMHTGSVWSTLDLPHGFVVGAGANGVAKRTASTVRDANTGLLREVPGYVTFDAMAKVPLSGKMTLQLNLYNIADKYYFDTIHPAHIIPGAGRTLLVSMTYEF